MIFDEDGNHEKVKIEKIGYPTLDPFGNIYIIANDITKLDENGNELWKINPKWNAYDIIYTFDSDGNLLITGWRTRGDDSNAVAHNYITTIKIDIDGNELWNNNFEYQSAFTQPLSIIADQERNIYVGGTRFRDSGEFFHAYEMLLIKYGPDGNELWFFTDPAAKSAQSLATDEDGNLYVAGTWQRNLEDDEDSGCGCGG